MSYEFGASLHARQCYGKDCYMWTMCDMNKMCGLASKEIRLYAACGSAARSPSPGAKPNPCGGSRIRNRQPPI